MSIRSAYNGRMLSSGTRFKPWDVLEWTVRSTICSVKVYGNHRRHETSDLSISWKNLERGVRSTCENLNYPKFKLKTLSNSRQKAGRKRKVNPESSGITARVSSMQQADKSSRAHARYQARTNAWKYDNVILKTISRRPASAILWS